MSELKNVIQALINEDRDAAEAQIKQYILDKTRDIAGLNEEQKSFLDQLLDELKKEELGASIDVEDSYGGDGKTEVFVSYFGWDALLEITVDGEKVHCKITHSEQNRGDADEEDSMSFTGSVQEIAESIINWVDNFMHDIDGMYGDNEDEDDDE